VVALGFLACLVFGFGLLAGRLEGTVVTAPIVLVAAGLVAGGTGILDFGAAAHATGGHSREAVSSWPSSRSCCCCSATRRASIRVPCAATRFRYACC
jgi:hypothetical protein